MNELTAFQGMDVDAESVVLSVEQNARTSNRHRIIEFIALMNVRTPWASSGTRLPLAG